MASKRRLRRRKCERKRRYDSHADAASASWGLRRAKHLIDPMTVYRCEFCGGYHFGRTPQRVQQSIAAMARRKAPPMMVPEK